jgi:drug/metabolite transporter (DMT)-like permease
LGAGAALVSGLAYAFLGVSIRRTVTQQVPIATVMFVVAATGILTMGSIGVLVEGGRALAAIPVTEYQWMLVAGLFTTAAFVCLTIALRETSVTYVNGLSAAQVAASSVLGHVLFGEPWTMWLVAGVALTVVGLWLLPHGEPLPKASARNADA